jgi:hypothetical protein
MTASVIDSPSGGIWIEVDMRVVYTPDRLTRREVSRRGAESAAGFIAGETERACFAAVDADGSCLNP